MALLEAKKLGISFGGLRAVDDFNISIEKGQLYGLIGPNGAGKTTAFNLLTGVYKADTGSIILDGKNIVGMNFFLPNFALNFAATILRHSIIFGLQLNSITTIRTTAYTSIRVGIVLVLITRIAIPKRSGAFVIRSCAAQENTALLYAPTHMNPAWPRDNSPRKPTTRLRSLP